MGLQEGRREHLLSDTLSDRELARVEERQLERQIGLRRAYGRGRAVLLAAALCTLITVFLLPRQYKISFPLASQIARLFMVYGYQGFFVVGFGAAALIGGIFLLFWWLSRRHHGWMIGATVLVALDGVSTFFMLNLMNYFQNIYNETAHRDVAAGVPGVGSPYNYMAAFTIEIAVHLIVMYWLIRGTVYGARLHRLPSVSIEEQTVEKAVYDAAEDYTEHPEEGTVPLRPVEPAAVRILRAKVRGMHVEVSRAYGVTVLAVDGMVYNDQKGAVEPAYTLRACVNGVHLEARHVVEKDHTRMVLYADGKQITSKKRYL